MLRQLLPIGRLTHFSGNASSHRLQSWDLIKWLRHADVAVWEINQFSKRSIGFPYDLCQIDHLSTLQIDWNRPWHCIANCSNERFGNLLSECMLRQRSMTPGKCHSWRVLRSQVSGPPSCNGPLTPERTTRGWPKQQNHVKVYLGGLLLYFDPFLDLSFPQMRFQCIPKITSLGICIYFGSLSFYSLFSTIFIQFIPFCGPNSYLLKMLLFNNIWVWPQRCSMAIWIVQKI